MSENTCSTCRHITLSVAAVEAQGEKPARPAQWACRRFPPQTHFIVVLRGNALMGRHPQPTEEQRSAFPPIQAEWCCGEHTPLLAMT